MKLIDTVDSEPLVLSLSQLTSQPCCSSFNPADYTIYSTESVLRCEECGATWQVENVEIAGKSMGLAISLITYEDCQTCGD